MTVPSSIEADALARLDADAMLARTRSWAQVNSGTANLAGLERMAGLLADEFAVLPGEIALVEAAHAVRVATDGHIEPIGHGRHLRLCVRPDAPVRLLLTGHMDTVYPVDHPFQTLTDLDGGRLNGPGVADMKGGLSLMLEALKAVETTPLAAKIGYEVLVNSDEETGSLSSAALIAEMAHGKTAALTYEPALPDGTLAGARGGTGNFSIRVTGRAAHAGRNPADGRNAIVAASDLALRLSRVATPGLTVNPARIDGGGPNNVVPDGAVLRVNFRPASAQDIEYAQTAVTTIAADIARDHGVATHVNGAFNRPPKPIDAGAARLFSLVRDSGASLGLDIGWRATGGVCDGNNIAAAGVPVVDTMGVRGGAIHSSDEFLIVDSLQERAALSVLTILRIAERGRL